MTEEVKPDETPTEVPELNETEAKAHELGWRPEEEFKADPKNEGKKWRTADEFLDRTSFYEKIDTQNRRIKALEQGTQALLEHNRKIEQSAYERAKAELMKERKLALEEEDFVKAEELRDKLDDLKAKPPTTPEPAKVAPEFSAWVDRNSWYERDPDMRAYADGVGQQLWANGLKDANEALPLIEKKVREVFKDKFKNPNRESAPRLQSGGAPAKKDSFTLSKEEEAIVDRMMSAGIKMSRDDYIKQIKAAKGVK